MWRFGSTSRRATIPAVSGSPAATSTSGTSPPSVVSETTRSASDATPSYWTELLDADIDGLDPLACRTDPLSFIDGGIDRVLACFCVSNKPRESVYVDIPTTSTILVSWLGTQPVVSIVLIWIGSGIPFAGRLPFAFSNREMARVTCRGHPQELATERISHRSQRRKFGIATYSLFSSRIK